MLHRWNDPHTHFTFRPRLSSCDGWGDFIMWQRSVSASSNPSKLSALFQVFKKHRGRKKSAHTQNALDNHLHFYNISRFCLVVSRNGARQKGEARRKVSEGMKPKELLMKQSIIADAYEVESLNFYWSTVERAERVRERENFKVEIIEMDAVPTICLSSFKCLIHFVFISSVWRIPLLVIHTPDWYSSIKSHTHTSPKGLHTFKWGLGILISTTF